MAKEFSFEEAIGSPKEDKEKKSFSFDDAVKQPTAGFSLKDLALAFGQGVGGGAQAISDVAGAGNVVSKGLSGLQQAAGEAMTPERQAEILRRQELKKKAEGNTWEEIKATLGGAAEAPLQTLAQGVGSMVPMIAGTLLVPEAAIPAAVARLTSLGVAPAVAKTVATSMPASTVGAIMGVGGQKGQDYETVKRELLERQVPEAEAERLAQKAAEYSLANAPRQIAGGAAGALEGALGVESLIGRAGKKLPEVKGPSRNVPEPTWSQAIGKNVAEEALPEAIQSAVGTAGTNVALTQAGIPTDITQGVVAGALHDALVGGVLGGAASPLKMRELRQEYVQDEAKAQQEYQQKQLDEIAALQKKINDELATTQNPLGTFKPDELGAGLTSIVEQHRAATGKPALTEYSLDDVVDALPGKNKAADTAALNALVAAKSGHAGEVYTPEQVIKTAQEKNVDTATQGFTDFLSRTTGINDPAQMSQPQLHAAITSLQKLPGFASTQALPEGSNATRYTPEQYTQAIESLNTKMDALAKDGLTVKEATKAIQTATGLKSQPITNLIADARRKGEIAFEPDGQLTIPTRTMPTGYAVSEEVGPEEETADSYDIMRGDEKLFTAPDRKSADQLVEKLGKTTGSELKRIDAELKALDEKTAKSEEDLNKLTIEGKYGTPEYKAAEAKHQTLLDTTLPTITELIANKESYSTPLTVAPVGAKKVKPKSYVVRKGQGIRTVKETREEAEQAIFEDLTDTDLQELAKKKSPALQKRVNAEIQRRAAQPAKTAEAKAATPEEEAKLEKLKQDLPAMLEKFGLKDVGLKIVDAIEGGAEGSYAGNLIQIALDATNPVRTMRHEAIHALKELGFFTPQQWAALERQAKKEWINKYLKDVPFRTDEGKIISRYEAYATPGIASKEGLNEDEIIEEAIADAFGDFDATKAPPGMLTALLNKLRNFFSALRSYLNGEGFQTYKDVFGKIEKGELKPAKPTKLVAEKEPVEPEPKPVPKKSLPEGEADAWKATPQEVEKADKYAEANGIFPYLSEGRLDLPLTVKSKYSLKTADKYGIDPVLGIPLNKDGTVTVYYHTTKPQAVKLNASKTIPSEGRSRIYLTNESNGGKILNNPGNFDQEFDGSTVLLNIDPSLLQVDEEYPDGRKDFFVPLAQGDFFNRKMNLSSIQKSRKEGIVETFTDANMAQRMQDSLDEYNGMDAAGQKARLKQVRALLKKEHNIGTLLSENGKLEKTRVGDYGLKQEEKSVASMGLGLASAQQITEKLSSCPQSAICEGLCLGETSGGNFLYGGAASEDAQGIEKSAFRAGPRMMQYLKTEALVVHPEEFAILLNHEISMFEKWAAKETERKKNKATGVMQTLEKEVYQPAIRLNVTSDFRPKMWQPIIEAHPDTEFYDYTKLNGETVAPNHHLTYSSTGVGQIIDGDKVSHKTNNWNSMRGRLDRGDNVAMAFSSKSALPETIFDEETGKTYQVWDGDNYDARFLDPKPSDAGNLFKQGMIIGLRNKASTLKEKTAAKDTDGFFIDYDPKRDGNSVTILDQSQFGFKSSKKVIPIAKMSLRAAPETPEFKRWFGDSKVVDANGNPLVVYHGTLEHDDYTEEEGGAFGQFTGRLNWFGVEPYTANGYSKGEGTSYPAYLSIKKPLRISQDANDYVKSTKFISDVGLKVEDFARDLNDLRSEEVWRVINTPKFAEAAQAAGYDGIEIDEGGYKTFAAFEPTQIKSATGNIGTYDVTNPDIRYSLRQAPDTPEFKRFFGRSKVVNDDGTPKVMYHGTARDITAFKPRQAGAIFLTENPEYAGEYADVSAANKALERDLSEYSAQELADAKAQAIKDVRDSYGNAREGADIIRQIKSDNPQGEALDFIKLAADNLFPSAGPNIMPVYVRAERPFDYENPDHVAALGLRDIDTEDLANNVARLESDRVQDAIRAAGFDGFYIKQGNQKNIAVYDPSQIKSATGNVGTFANTPDIRYSLRGAMTDERLDRLMNEYARNDGKVSAGITWIRPQEFLDAVNSREFQEYLLKQQDKYGAPNLEQQGSMYLLVDDNGRIIGHEGRNRMLELNKEGIERTAILIRRYDASNDPLPTSLLPQKYTEDLRDDWGFRTVVVRPTPITYANEKSLRAEYANKEDKRFSLRNIQDEVNALPNGAAINASINRLTYAREKEGFFERIINAFKPQSVDALRQQFLNRYNQLGVYDRELAKQMGGAALLADSSAESAALMSDNAAAIAAMACGIEGKGGVPVFNNGFTTISNANGEKGVLEILMPLAQTGDPRIYQTYQFWAGAKRGSRLLASGKDHTYTPAEIAYAKELCYVDANGNVSGKYPEFAQVQKDWIEYNNGLMKYAVATGVLAPEKAAEFMKYSDYIPFYRQIDGETTVGPKLFQNISGVTPPKKLKGLKEGQEVPLADFLETVVRNTQSIIQSGMKNTAAQRAIGAAIQLKTAQKRNDVSYGPGVVTVLEKGKPTSYDVADPLFIDAVKSLNLPELPFLSIFSAPANLLRNMVTKDPGFMMANLMRDSLSAWVTSGAKMTPIASTISNFGKAIGGKDPAYIALRNAGVIGGYEFATDIKTSGATLGAALRRQTKTEQGAEKALRPFNSLWRGLEKGTEASDAATRMAVYKATLERTGNEAEAIYRAMEVMNFNRKGNLAIVRILTAAVPFLNARMQGLDVFYRAMFGKMASEDAAAIQRSFFIRGATLMSLSAMYWFLTHDDEEYLKQEQETRDNNWLFPSLGIRIPTPFEVGTLFKTIPERLLEYSFGNDTGKDLSDSMKRALISTFAFNPIPQTVLPLVEARTNYSFYTMRPIVGQGMEGVANEYQVAPGTSEFAKKLGKALGESPMMIDHIMQGYTGSMGMYAVDLIDAILMGNDASPKPAKRFEQMPVIKRFALDKEAKGTVTSYYDLKNSVDEVVRTINLMERTGNAEDMGDYFEKNANLFGMRSYISSVEKQMKVMREASMQIRGSDMSPEDKRDSLLAITQAQNAMTANIREIKKVISQ